MSDLRELNNAVQGAEFPSHEFAQAVRVWVNAATGRVEPVCPNCKKAVGTRMAHWLGHPHYEWDCQPAQVEPAAPVEMPEGSNRSYTAENIREWIRARGYLDLDQHNRFGGKLPTSNMGACMAALADALDEIEVLRDHSRTVEITPELERVLCAAADKAVSEDISYGRANPYYETGKKNAHEIRESIAAVRQQYGKGRG